MQSQAGAFFDTALAMTYKLKCSTTRLTQLRATILNNQGLLAELRGQPLLAEEVYGNPLALVTVATTSLVPQLWTPPRTPAGSWQGSMGMTVLGMPDTKIWDPSGAMVSPSLSQAGTKITTPRARATKRKLRLGMRFILPIV